MQVRVQKWGNSLALRIPKSFAAEVRFEPGSLAEMSVIDGKIVISPCRTSYSISDLSSRISASNIHAEVSWGRPEGREAW